MAAIWLTQVARGELELKDYASLCGQLEKDASEDQQAHSSRQAARAAGDKHSGEVVKLVLEAQDLQGEIRSLEERFAKQLMANTNLQRSFSIMMLSGSCQRALSHMVSTHLGL